MFFAPPKCLSCSRASRRPECEFTAQHFIERIDGDRLEVYGIWGGLPRRITGVEALVMAVGRVPNDALFDEIEDSFKEVHRVRDELAPRRPAEVIHEAEKLAREI
jgi:hypothetical protein